MPKAELRGRRRLLDDFFKVDELTVAVERFDGSAMPPVRRLVFERGDAVAAVVRHVDSGRLLFTEQFRAPTMEKGPGWLLEVMAGMIDGAEAPEAALRRELHEELGYAVKRLEPIATFYVSPGGSSERIWLFYAEVAEVTRSGRGGGLAGENEDIRIVEMTDDEARAALAAGRLPDAKTIIGLQWLFARTRGAAP
jgi:nudix-type nucleoside diphosphatase (YffH/AdpP family)